LEARKKYPPKNTVVDMVSAIGIELLTEEQYRKLQSIEAFDLKTSSWVQTPPEIDRKSTRLNSSHVSISYAVFCLKKKKIKPEENYQQRNYSIDLDHPQKTACNYKS